MEAIANGPLSQLFALMIIPVIAAILLGGFLIFSFARRRKRSRMKHGLRPARSKAEEAATADEIEINPAILSSDASPMTSQVVSSENSLDLGLLSNRVDMEIVDTEATMENRLQSPANQEPVDLASRLGPSRANSIQPAQPLDEPVELLRLLRNPQSGQLIVEIAGQRYTKLANITDKKIGQYILQVTAHLLAFTNGVIVTDKGMKSIYKPILGKTPEPIAAPTPTFQPSGPSVDTSPTTQKTEPDIPEPSPEADAAFLDSVNHLPRQLESPPKKGGLFGRISKPASPPSSRPGLNLAEEINEIVQARLRYSPLAENNEVVITSDLTGGIRIKVNSQFYSSPDDIPDPEIKKLIKASIKEWERT